MISVNVGATFPDDFEDSPLKSEILQKRNPNPGVDESYHPVSISLDISIALRYWQFVCQTMEDIYESIRGKPATEGTKAAKPAQEEREPELDEMWFFSSAFNNLDMIHE